MGIRLDGSSGISCTGNIYSSAGVICAVGNVIAGNIVANLIANNATFPNNVISSNVTATTIFYGPSASITGNATVGGILNGGSNGVGNIGSSSTYFNTAFIKATSAQYADLAEMYVSDYDYLPGTVVEFGGEHEITASSSTHSPKVAGIISTAPSYLMNATQTGKNVLPVALIGRVPCKVIGIINKGDRLVASDITGIAGPMDPMLYEPGCIIGKALESYDDEEEVGIIDVAVGRD